MTLSTLHVTINGEPREVAPPSNLSALLEALGVDRRLVAVALNGDVVRRDDHERTRVSEGDRIEIVRMVGGG